MTEKSELPEKYINHFNEMKVLMFDKSIKSESEFIKKAKAIGEKHFGHQGVIITDYGNSENKLINP